MENKRSLLLGLVPTRRDLDGEFFCNSQAALRRKLELERKLNELGVEYVNLDFLNAEGIIKSGLDADAVAERFRSQGVDALFCPHLNFGTEDAIAKIGRLMNVPLLLWGPRDDAPDAAGNRLTDSQCGLFATGKVLRQFGVPFTYMTNCATDDPTFERVLGGFMSVAHAVKSFRHMRVGQFGVRPETFWSVKCNEMQLLERFGIEVVPATMLELQGMYEQTLREHGAELERIAAGYRERMDVRIGQSDLIKAAALQKAIRDWADANQVDAIASNCWGPMRQIGGISACFTFAELTEQYLPVVCETDIHGAISSVLAQSATRWQQASFLADITTRHPTNANAELLWHCGVFPRSTALGVARIDHNFDENRPGVMSFQMKPGDITIARFDVSDDRYQLLTAQGARVDGPHTSGAYGWFEFPNWPELEHRLVTGPYIHHCAGVYARISPILHEACKYIPGLAPDPVQPGEREIREFWM